MATPVTPKSTSPSAGIDYETMKAEMTKVKEQANKEALDTADLKHRMQTIKGLTSI
jgi:hypothetical protein